ncbi:MAG: TonB-dependent receptor, partial [Flavobacterium sp.]
MKIIKQFTCVLLLCCGIAFGQNSGKINGQLAFPANPESVLLQLLSADGKTLIKTEISEPDGSFTFKNLLPGNYIVIADDEKYSYHSEPISLSPEKPEFTISAVLTKKSTQLSEVTVQKKKQIIENRIDKTIVNVDAMITAAGGDAMEVLEKSPGIVVDENGTITFKGKTGVAVFIDDKPSYLSGAELEAYLKSLPASTLNQIELMTNPPAKYDAAGGGGVINIITKKSKARGFNGSATARLRQGKKGSTNESVNLNYVEDKIRIFGNLSYSFQQPRNDLYIYRIFKNEDLTTKSYFDQYSYLTGKNNSGTARVGMDYYASEKTTFGVNLTGMLRSSKKSSDVESVLRNAALALDSTIIARNTTDNHFSNVGVNLNFRHDLEKGRKITADADYLNYSNATDQRFRNFVYQPDNSLTSQDEQIGDLPSDIDIISLKTDYSHPLKNDGSFETGYKISISKTDNVADYRDIVGDSQMPNFDMSNHFKYDEIINAAYVNFNTTYKRFTFQTGLRLENTQSKGNQLGNEVKPASRFSHNYTNLFPTVYVQYKLDSIGNNQLVTSYGKRINRPYYEDLNPFISPLDKFTFYSGNPYLNPSFAHYV